MDKQRFNKGMRIRKQVLGPAHVARSWADAQGDEFMQPLQEMITEIGWGAIWGRPGSSARRAACSTSPCSRR
jgi:4-carboxymuconolactone decarboxylase